MNTVFVDADWQGLNGPIRVGTARVSIVRGHETVSFEFSPAWLESHGGLMLDPLLIQSAGWQYPAGGGFPGILHDSAPDRWGRLLMRRREAEIARREGRREKNLTELDFLLGVSDATRVGGLRFRRESNGPFLEAPTGMDVPPLASLRKLEAAAGEVDADEGNPWTADMALLLAPGSSLGGARPKATVIDPDGQLWVAKFPSSRDDIDVGGWEAVTQDLARQCGLRTVQTRATRCSRNGHTFLIRRFDRGAGKRVHFASAMCLLGAKDGDGAATGFGYLDIADLILRAGAAPDQDLAELWRRIVFGILVRNTDDHLRNHGFLLDRAGWRLSPVYDVNPDPHGVAGSLNISESSNRLDLSLTLETAPHFRVSHKDADAFIGTAKRVISRWRSVALDLGLRKSGLARMERAFRCDG